MEQRDEAAPLLGASRRRSAPPETSTPPTTWRRRPRTVATTGVVVSFVVGAMMMIGVSTSSGRRSGLSAGTASPPTVLVADDNTTPSATAAAIETAYGMLSRLYERDASVDCAGTTFAFCGYASCEMIHGTNLTWCECRVYKNVTGQLGMNADSAYLLWSATFREAVAAAFSGAWPRATDLVCDGVDDAVGRSPWWLADVVPGFPATGLMLSLSDTGESTTFAAVDGTVAGVVPPAVASSSPQTQGSGCDVTVAECMGAPCYAAGDIAYCACPIKFASVPSKYLVQQDGVYRALQLACADSRECGVHQTLSSTPTGNTNMLGNLDEIAAVHDQMLQLRQLPSDAAFRCELLPTDESSTPSPDGESTAASRGGPSDVLHR